MLGTQAADQIFIADLRAGNESAARDLFERYCGRLLDLARRRLSPKVAQRVDPEDIVQSVFRTFFTRVRNNEFILNGVGDLFGLLVQLTIRKAIRQMAFHRAAKRNPDMEVDLVTQDRDLLVEICASGPPPDVEVSMANELEQFLLQLKPLDRKVLEMKLDGHSTAEIAIAVGSYERKIRRSLERIYETAKAAI